MASIWRWIIIFLFFVGLAAGAYFYSFSTEGNGASGITIVRRKISATSTNQPIKGLEQTLSNLDKNINQFSTLTNNAILDDVSQSLEAF